MNARLYDTADGIAKALTSLEGLHGILAERRAARDRGERLGRYVLLGRFMSDEYGQAWRLSGYPSNTWSVDEPLAISEDEFVRARGDVQWTMGRDTRPASSEWRCYICEQPWALVNCHDHMGGEDRRGHRACVLNALAEEQEGQFRLLFQLADFPQGELTRVPNEYGSESYRGPWFKATFEFGTILIGWRKRVINIDWSATEKSFPGMFSDSQNTGGPGYIHAWGYDQAFDFLKRLRKGLEPDAQAA